MGAQSENLLHIEYMPLRVGEVSSRLELTSADLGLFAYDLRLVAGEPKHERPTYFQTNLGMQQVTQVKIVNYCKSKCDFALKIKDASAFWRSLKGGDYADVPDPSDAQVDNADFHVEKKRSDSGGAGRRSRGGH